MWRTLQQDEKSNPKPQSSKVGSHEEHLKAAIQHTAVNCELIQGH